MTTERCGRCGRLSTAGAASLYHACNDLADRQEQLACAPDTWDCLSVFIPAGMLRRQEKQPRQTMRTSASAGAT
jgi:hypothetical protein